MEKKIIGYKLIKKYPGLHYTLGQFSPANVTEYSSWPEFWQPIYEEVGVDLEKILMEAQVCGEVERIIIAMKEACKQTLELTLKECIGIKLPIEHVRKKILNLIK